MTRYDLRWSLSLVIFACGGGDPGSDGSPGTGTSTASGSTESDSSTTDAVADGSSSTGGETSTRGPAESSSESEGSSDSTTDPIADCDAVPPGPFAATRLFEALDLRGSEDLGFDGAGGFAARSGQRLVHVTAEGELTELAPNLPSSWGLRYRDNGELLVAAYQQGRIIAVDAAGASRDFATGLGSVNGLYPDVDDTVWFTNLDLVGRIDDRGEVSTIVENAGSTNGIVHDPVRGLLFYSTYSEGELYRVPIGDDGIPGTPTAVGRVEGASFDGISLDACGNVYAVDQPNGGIIRFFLDGEGALDGEPEALLEAPVPTSIANAQFGSGEGFATNALYAIGDGGGLYRIDVGIEGARTVVPE